MDTYTSKGLDGSTVTVTTADAQDVATYILSLPASRAQNDLQWAISPSNSAGARFYVAWIFAYTLGLLPSWPTTDGAGTQILNCGYIPPNLVVKGDSYYTKPPGNRTSKIT